jgi:hypothetical protein
MASSPFFFCIDSFSPKAKHFFCFFILVILCLSANCKTITFDVERRFLTEDPIQKIHRLAKNLTFNDIVPMTMFEATRDVDLQNFKNVQYFAPLFIGASKQKMTFIFDTGSEWLWVPLDTCSSCQLDVYTPTESFKDSKQKHTITYGSGTVKGTIATDEVRILEEDDKLSMKLLGVTEEIGIQGTQADGILGLAPSSTDGSDLLVEKLNKMGIIDNKSFGVDINIKEKQSRITLGGYDDSKVSSDEDFIYLSLHNNKDWWVPHSKVKYGAFTATSKGGLTVFDTGTSITTFQMNTYYAILTALQKASKTDCFFNDYQGDTYLHCPCNQKEDFESIDIQLKGYLFSISTDNYILELSIDNVNT